jgi:hypothetical protein
VFFAGLSAKLKLPLHGLVMLALAWIMLLAATIILVQLPVKVF